MSVGQPSNEIGIPMYSQDSGVRSVIGDMLYRIPLRSVIINANQYIVYQS